MTDRPIILPPPSIRALLDGRLSRVVVPVKMQHVTFGRGVIGERDWRGVGSIRPTKGGTLGAFLADFPGASIGEVRCPLGGIGDRLYVKETYAESAKSGNRQVAYAADGKWYSRSESDKYFRGYVTGVTDKVLANWGELSGHWVGRSYFAKWRSPATMPKWAARIWLTIRDVAVVRVHDITELQAKQTGVPPHDRSVRVGATHLAEFACQWDTRWGKSFPWSGNPWGWNLSIVRDA